ncbi:MAG: sugar phosphate isomerase/epimerase [Chthoniobacteraceae bacterium]
MNRLFAVLTLLALATSALAGDFKGTAGLQLYSLREMMKTDLPGALDRAKAFGFTEVEGGGFIKAAPGELVAMLKERGMTLVSTHFSFKPLAENLDQCVKEAQALGVKFAVCPWIDHEIGNFGDADVQKAAAVFNRAGKAFQNAGISFGYHVHGFEFRPVAEGASETFFDRLAAATSPELVGFEMDVLWVVLPGADPVKLLEKYGSRWQLMHLKDLKKGVRTGVYTGKTELTNDVALGTGQVDWPAVLRTAAKVGVKHYFIEDESPTVLDQIPASLAYLKTLN